MASRDPDPHPARNRDHRSARKAEVTSDADAVAETLTRVPFENSTRIDGPWGSGSIGSGADSAGVSTTTAGANPDGVKYARRHL